MTHATSDPRVGATLAGYRLDSVLGRGGMGVVYRAEHLTLRRAVALKLVAPGLALEPRFRERFLAESRLAASLEHPNVIPIYDAGEADGQLYLAMRLVEGESLRELLAREAPLSPARAIELLSPVASALDAAHARGLVHRDVKPANILLEAEGDGEHVYLSDFGLARLAGEARPEELAHLSGSLHYVAPEQITERAVDPAADVYALACVLYECLTGEPPYRETSPMTLLWAHVYEVPPRASERNPKLSQAIDTVLARALAKEPAERHATCGELIAAAARALGVRLAPSRKRPLLLAAALALIAAAAVATSLALTLGTSPPQAARPTTVITRDTLQRIDPNTNKLVATIPYGQANVREKLSGSGWVAPVAVGAGYVWVFGPRIQTVMRIDPKTNTVSSTSAVSLEPDAEGVNQITFGLDAAFGHVWAVTNTASVTVIDPRTGLTSKQIPIPGVDTCFFLNAAFEGVWVWCDSGPARPASAWRIDPRTDTPVHVLDYGNDRFRLVIQPGELPGARVFFDQGATVFAVYDLAAAKRVASFNLPFYIGGFDARESPTGAPDGDTSGWVSNPEASTVWQLDPIADRVARRIPVGSHPTGVAVGDHAVWVANSTDGTVSRIDPTSGKVVATVTVGGRPQSVAVGEGGVWVTTNPSQPATTAPPTTKAAATEQANAHITATIPIPGGARGILAYAFGSVWQPVDQAKVDRIDPATNRVIAAIPVGTGPDAALGAFGSVWVTNCGGTVGTVSRIDPATNRVVATIKLGLCPFGIGVLDGSVWVANGLRVSRIDPATNRVIADIKVPTGLAGCDNMCWGPWINLAAGAGAVWVTSFRSRVFRIDPATNRVSGAVKFGPCCKDVSQGVVVAFGSVWATLGDRHAIARIDPSTLKVTAVIHSVGSPSKLAAIANKIWLGGAEPSGSVVQVIDPATNKIATWAHVGDFSGPGAGGAGSIWANSYDGGVYRISPS